jgi:hypothetical protein
VRKRKGEKRVDLQRTVEIMAERKSKQLKTVGLIAERLCPEPRAMRLSDGARVRHEQSKRDLAIKQQSARLRAALDTLTR